ncbi:MAG: hypothetical protein DWQ09_03365 [Proteobacteria bacterium]|nr:MAG: hypothetical protein DWQ09_03365 [Pseudomonadota bacterium]QKK11049.1 MAG: hypothetical protein HND59_05000 [Pseudomonadota bacterium]
MRVLVIGATGVAGSSGIAAVREVYGEAAEITGVWYGKPDPEHKVDGANHTLFGDITDLALYEQIADQAGKQFDWCLYATAHGEVGFPVNEATAEQIDASNRLSVDPLRVLEARFDIGNLVAYSTFYNLEHQKITYGAMGHSKAAIEQWALETGRSRHWVIRAGAFKSTSSQGIKLLVRRRAKQLAESDNALLRRYFEGVKPSEAVENLERAVLEEERERFGDTGTDAASLVAAHVALFKGCEAPFVNVCGRKIWVSAEVQPLG